MGGNLLESGNVQDVFNLADTVRQAAGRDGGIRPAFRWQDQQLSWAELDAQVDAVAVALRALFADAESPGTEPSGSEPKGTESTGSGGSGARPMVAFALPNVPEFVVAYFGALRAGVVVVPVNPGYTARELRQVLDDAGASVLIGTPAVLNSVAAGSPDAPRSLRHTFVVGDPAGGEDVTGSRPFSDLLAGGHPLVEDRPGQPPAWDRPNAGVPAPVAPTTGGEDLAVLLYTSGTSGTPKGVMLSHRALLANQIQLAAIDPPPMSPDDVMLITLPLFHSYGLNTGLGAVAYHGACGVLVERFDPTHTLTQVVRHKVTVVVGVPPMFVAWSLMGDEVARAFAGVRLAASGAAPLDQATARRFTELTGRPVHEGYGLTETAPVLTSTFGLADPKAGSIGRPLPEVEIKLIDAAGERVRGYPADDDFDDETAGSPGTDPGEIVARGPNLFSGYWPDGAGGPDADGWWATGDVAYADADGDLFLVDRIGELIIVNGFNVYPKEIELVLRAHPAISDAAVVGVAHPYTGRSVKAYVVRAAGAGVTAEEVIAYSEQNLARFKCPTAVEFVAQLPRSATGKVRKSELERIYG
jgi:long-chain acyl-CoA synthetase